MPRARRPEGTITRGKTAPNRLRRVDRWIVRVHGPELRRQERPLVVDLGYGASPITTVELFGRLRAVHPRVEVVGIEIDPDRVAAARPYEREGLSFRLGGFELPVERPPALIRAFNVLRQYEEAEAWQAWDRLCAGLAPGGVLVEGTCDEIGRRAVWVSLRRTTGEPPARADVPAARGPAEAGGPWGRSGRWEQSARREPGGLRDAEGRPEAAGPWDPSGRGESGSAREAGDRPETAGPWESGSAREASRRRGPGGRRTVPRPRDGEPAGVPQTITFAAHLPTLSRPSDLTERLPKTLIHRNVPGEPVHALLTAFDRAWASAAPRSVFGPRQRWIAAVELLSREFPVHTTPPLGGRGRWRLGEVTVPWPAVAPRPGGL
ncbi:class I SAM-dependent methyltransferase [Actinoallomurus iriomotensis]|uniref:Class I SAM-dependent methyltransferase n=1 Tax=Actinoallomurus iriomotensis TaxID=478107 RepID=A0A9W6S134_9ACTN|nr:class I SAM-dependent methyltransferase [Actinoallomurus iriomotensis]GLY83717.1 hypothetical protein Airi02_016460 [Actinoallomurus iriomotensis]